MDAGPLDRRFPPPADVHLSVSTWQQPFPKETSPERTSLLVQVAERIVSIGAGRLRIAIDGLTASGKTTFGHELARHITHAGRPVLRASLDDFKRPWNERHLYDRESGEGYYRNAFDYERVVELLLEPCTPEGSGECSLCSIDPLLQIDHSAVVTNAERNAVLIVDGVFALRPEINNHWDFRIWLDVDAELSERRGTQRDFALAGPDAGGIHRDRYAAAERLYISEEHPQELADVVIDNSRFTRPRILRFS